jgi:hypothetical protein
MKSTSVLKTGERDMSASGTHNPPEFKHAEDMEWEMGRFGNVTKFLFHPRPERPTEPNAGFLKYAPGASFPLHRHDFAQVWYIIEGEFTFAGKALRPWHDRLYGRPAFRARNAYGDGRNDLLRAIPRSDDRRPADLRRPDLKDAPTLAQQDLEH